MSATLTCQVRVEVWDNDKPGSLNLKDHQLQGIGMFTMAELMTSNSMTVRKVREEIASSLRT